MGRARDLSVGTKATRPPKAIRVSYLRLRYALFDPASTLDDLAAALAECPEARRPDERIIAGEAWRRINAG